VDVHRVSEEEIEGPTMKLRKTPFKHWFRGRQFKVVFKHPGRGLLGTCDYDQREIEVKPGQKGPVALHTLIHEGLHACFPDLRERTVGRVSIDLCSFILQATDD
jgi:hypothetical protein